MTLIEKITTSILIEDVLEDVTGVQLKKTSRGYIGRCPFHSDNSPSFYVYTNSNKCHCFAGCLGHKPIDAIGVVEIAKNMTTKEAVNWLAKTYNISERTILRERAPRREESTYDKEKQTHLLYVIGDAAHRIRAKMKTFKTMEEVEAFAEWSHFLSDLQRYVEIVIQEDLHTTNDDLEYVEFQLKKRKLMK